MKRRGCRIAAWLAGGAFFLCIAAAGISGLTNLFLPKGWKERSLGEGVYLEDLVREAVGAQ